MEEVRWEAADHGEMTPNGLSKLILSISRKITEGSRKIPKDNNIWLMHDEALEL